MGWGATWWWGNDDVARAVAEDSGRGRWLCSKHDIGSKLLTTLLRGTDGAHARTAAGCRLAIKQANAPSQAPRQSHPSGGGILPANPMLPHAWRLYRDLANWVWPA